MTKIDIGELHHFADIIKTENEKARRYVEQLKEAIQNYINDTRLKGKAIDAAQTYFSETYLALCDSIIEAIPISSEKIPRYIQDFHDQVDPSYNAVVDADGLAELDQQIDRLERRMEDIQRKLGIIGTGSNQEGQLNQLRAQVTATYKKEQMKENYLHLKIAMQTGFVHFDIWGKQRGV
ncbi:hypothetical protein D8X85_03080 [Listeria seeligeri]|uniref:T7SS effector LXG polymorphic toxin n=1 Tax=Listeria seeligeri TaxID=1640 RepID=UPI0019441643|nr:T7SS effector LXG polymorphic toxin [Listeria seeligeri]MBM5604523.1 hypothetical protein [Listeria seeligeri]MBM5676202.1 hypothetical protein [Listeria seeligeri]